MNRDAHDTKSARPPTIAHPPSCNLQKPIPHPPLEFPREQYAAAAPAGSSNHRNQRPPQSRVNVPMKTTVPAARSTNAAAPRKRTHESLHHRANPIQRSKFKCVHQGQYSPAAIHRKRWPLKRQPVPGAERAVVILEGLVLVFFFSKGNLAGALL